MNLCIPALCLILASGPTMPKAPYVLPQTVREWQARGIEVAFVDVRQHEEFAAGHLDGALNIPHTEIETRHAEILRDRPYVIYCIHSSWRAPYVGNFLADLGYENVHVLEGGISAWHAGGQVVYATSYPEDLSTSLEHPHDRAYDPPLELTLDELRAFDGMDGRRAFVALDGIVYDVTNSRLWRGGEHDPARGKALAGHDLTEIFDDAPHGKENLKRFPVVGRIVAK